MSSPRAEAPPRAQTRKHKPASVAKVAAKKPRLSAKKRAAYLRELQKIAADRGGRCLSPTYTNSRTRMRWECSEGHQWQATASSVKSGSWCRQCASKRLRVKDDPREQAILAQLKHLRRRGKATIEDMHNIAAVRGGQCLSPAYRGSGEKLRWRCDQGHEFERTPASVKQGSWCLRCRGRNEHSIENMHAIAHERGGKCLSKRYRSMRTPMKWQCETGHTWTACAETVLRGSWCPECFGQSRGSIEKLRELARMRGGVCMSDHYVNNLHKLRWRCRHGHEWDARPMNIVMGTWCPTCAKVARGRKGKRKRTLEEMQALAATRGGRCMSDAYANYSTKLEWQCREGHQWMATPKSIIHGSWCPVCAVESRGTLQRCKELARSRGGQCLSTSYVSGRLPISWSCHAGHRFTLSWLQAKGGKWCPVCARSGAHAKSQTRRHTHVAAAPEPRHHSCTRHVHGSCTSS